MLENKDGKCVLGGGVYTYNLRIGESQGSLPFHSIKLSFFAL